MHRILMGNEAMGRGIVECGCTLAASYPGTPASKILAAVAACMARPIVRQLSGSTGRSDLILDKEANQCWRYS